MSLTILDGLKTFSWPAAAILSLSYFRPTMAAPTCLKGSPQALYDLVLDNKTESIAGPFLIGFVVICFGAVITAPSSSRRAIGIKMLVYLVFQHSVCDCRYTGSYHYLPFFCGNIESSLTASGAGAENMPNFIVLNYIEMNH